METDQLGRLRDIREAARLITSYVAGTTELTFRGDMQKQDAFDDRFCQYCPVLKVTRSELGGVR